MSPSDLNVHSHTSARQVLLRILTVAGLAVALSVALVAIDQPAAQAKPTDRAVKVKTAFKVASRQKGTPYRYGGNGPRGFDCSGLTSYAYRKAHIKLPRTSSAQARVATRIRKKRLHRGDLMFFKNRGGIYHVGMFAGRAAHGRAKILHAPYPGRRVRTERVWTSHWYPATMRFR